MAEVVLTGYMEWLEETGADQALRVVEAEKALHVPLVPGVRLLSKLDARVDHEELGGRYALEHKGQPLTAIVMTPSGPTQMGKLAVGDFVIGSDGQATRVIAIQDLGVQDLLRVTFTDTSSVCVTEDHLWTLWDQTQKKFVTRTTRSLAGLRGLRRFKIPRVGWVEFEERDLPIPPYTMGVLIGDGNLRRGSEFGNADFEVFENTAAENEMVMRKDGRGLPVGRLSQYRGTLRDLGLLGKYSHEKFIPEEYLYASSRQRFDLLQGLMDTDGSGGRQARFTTSSPRLADDFRLLIESFGGTIVFHESMGHVGTVQDGYDTRPCWQGTVQGIPDVLIHRIARKQHVRKFQHERGRVVHTVEPAGRAASRCIKVSAADGLYVTEHFIVTHNTVSTIKPPAHLRFATQFLTEHLVEFLALQGSGREGEGAVGVLWNALLKSKRTARAKGPFFAREPVRHSTDQLRSHWHHVVAIAQEILVSRKLLTDGESHHLVCHPNPTTDCSWDCPFVRECALIDESAQRSEAMIEARFETGDPLARYRGLIDPSVEST